MDLFIFDFIRNHVNKERFDTTEKKVYNLDGFVYFLFTLFIVYYLVIYIKIVIAAFNCSFNEGIIAIFFSTMWSSWKFITMVNKFCVTQK